MDVFQKALEQLNELLNENGVFIKGSRYESPDKLGLVIGISGLDFSEHDKNFLSDIKCLEEQNAKLEREIDEKKEEIDRINELNDKCCEENIRLTRENKELHRELQEASITYNLPYEPIAVAEMLINATEKYEHNAFTKSFTGNEQGAYNIYGISELRQIAEHLLVYCNNNKDEG